jgi:outer membrane receptor protein involved in Fe transport
MVSTALASVMMSGAAAAQSAGGDVLGEIVVTATKQADTVNRVPLSITAVTQANIDQQGIKNIQDLGRTVPGLQITPGNVANGTNIAIRGVASTVGASTTGIYIDDVPLQRRTTLGAFSGSGVAFPYLFDLERVEVLRGPQGTLYGGSAQGGAVRFISPAPSLVSYSALARAEISSTKDGAMNHEVGLALGGPIVQDKLAFRASVILKRDSGYIDHVDQYTGKVIGENTNGDDRSAYRVVLLFQPTTRLSLTAAGYSSREHHKDADNYWANVAAYTVPTQNFTATGAVAPAGTVPNFTLPGFTYGPYNVFGPYKTGQNCNIGANFKDRIAPCYGGNPRTNGLTILNLTADYDMDFALAHFTTAYIADRNKGSQDSSIGELAGYQGGNPFAVYTFPQFYGVPVYKNERNGISEELRFSSKGGGPFTWVAGAFYSYQRTRSRSHDYTNEKDIAPFIRGVPDTVLYGAPVAANGDITDRDQKLKEVELAGFGEASYFVTDKLKLTAGGRYAKTRFSYRTLLKGSFFGYEIPTVANGGDSSGIQSESSFSPKFGAQYNISDNDNVYVTAAKGFRMGGVNTGPFAFKCASTFTALGITDTPREFQSDTLWSYEGGAKMRVFGGRAQINASLFYIEWKDVQVNYALPAPCGFSYTANAGGAVSKGGDISAQFKLVGGLSASVQAAYTNAKYTDAVVGPAPTSSIFIRKGDTLPVPKYNVNLGLRYDFTVADDLDGYIRTDWQHASAYKRGFGPGSSTYNVDTYVAEATDFVTLRAAMLTGGFEFSIFANNLFNSQDILAKTGGRSCGNAECTIVRSNNPVFNQITFRPRTVGITVTYRR